MKYIVRFYYPKTKKDHQIPEEQFEEIKKTQGYKCAMCGIRQGTVVGVNKKTKRCITIKLTQDHIWPRSKGGATIKSNIQALCHRCNSQKTDKVIRREKTTTGKFRQEPDRL